MAFSVNGVPLDATKLGHLSAFYYYAYTPMQLPVGLMMDRYGPRNILIIAILSCAGGTLLFAYAPTLGMAALGRFLIGFGSAFAFVGVLKLASTWLPANRFALVSGLTTTLGMVGAMFAGTYLSVVIEDIGWRQTLYYSSFVGFILFPIIWFVIRDQPKNPLDNHSVGQDVEISYSQLLKDIAVALKNKQVWINGLIGSLLMAPTVVFAELWGTSYLKTVESFDVSMASKAVAMVFLGWAIGSPIAGYLSDKIGRRKPLLIVGALTVTALLATMFYYPHLTFIQIFILLLLVGIFSSVEILCFAIGRENFPAHLSGTIIAVTNFIIVSGAIFQVMVGKLLDKGWSGEMVDMLKVYSADNYRSALFLLPILTLIALILTFFLKETYCKQVVED
jgi:MFS family permease